MTSSSAVEDELLTDSDLTDDEARKEEVKPEEIRPVTPRPTYSDEELNQLVEYIQRMTVLYSLNQRDWNEQSLDDIRRWLLEVGEPLLTIFYKGNTLTSLLGFPTEPVDDISYFMRNEPNEIFTVEGFHDEVHFGTVHSDVDGCLMYLLERFFAPLFRSYKEWNDTVRNRFCASLDRLLTFLFCMNSKMGGITVLYVPFVLHQFGDGEQMVCDRALFKSLETIVFYWIVQIRTALGDNTLVVPNDLATVQDEFEFWEYRLEVLQGLNSQLQQFDLQRILKVLRQGQSVHIPQIEQLIERGKLEEQLAASNIQFLRLLVEPCAQIDAAASPASVSQLLPRIIHLMRFIWENSQHYRSNDKILILFRNLSNQIIKYCTEQINLDEILDGHPRFGIKMCNLSLDCLQAYKEHIAVMQVNVAWQLDQGIIFNHVNAFMERLRDLMDICEAMIVFGRLDENEQIEQVEQAQFSGTSGEQLEKISANVGQQFLQILSELRGSESKQLMLNVYRGEWYEHVARYRRSVQHMEETLQRLISSVFQHACNVEEALEALNSMLYYSYHATLRQCYLRQVSYVWQLFSEDMDATTRHLLQANGKQHLSWLPPHVSRTLGYRINLERLTRLHTRLLHCSSTWLPVVPEAASVLAKFKLLRTEFERQMRMCHDNWQQSYAVDRGQPNLCQRLDRHLLVRGKQPKALLQCNIDPMVLQIIAQAKHFERLGFPVPLPMRKLYERHDTLRYVYNSLLLLCLDYNCIMNALSAQERKLLRPLISACDRQLAPGIFKLTYGAIVDPSEGYSQWLEDCVDHIEYVRQLVQLYKRANLQIARNCEKICDISMLELSFNGAVDIAVFEQQLSTWLNRGNSSLRMHYNNIMELMMTMSLELEDVREEVPQEWHRYVNVFDDMLACALLSCVRSTLELLQETLHCEEGGAVLPAPILVTEADIKHSQIVFSPDLQAIGQVLRGVIDRVKTLVDQFQRLGHKLKLPKAERRPGFARELRDDVECCALVHNIDAEIARQQEQIADYVQHWQRHQKLWQMTEEAFTKKLMKGPRTAGVFEGAIEYFSTLADEITFMDAISHVHFLLVNQNPIKNTLLDWIEKWQALNIKLLLDHATSRMQSLYRYMEENKEKVMQVPRTHSASIAAHELFEQLINALARKQAKMTPMLELFVLLHKYRVPWDEQTRRQIIELETNWLHYLQTLAEADDMLDNEGDEYKVLLAQHADRFKLILKEFHEDFFSKLPKK